MKISEHKYIFDTMQPKIETKHKFSWMKFTYMQYPGFNSKSDKI